MCMSTQPKKPNHQFSLSFIERRFADSIVPQRAEDGYIDATALCAAAGKPWWHYKRDTRVGAFLRALAQRTHLSEAQLAQQVVTQDGVTKLWVHPKVAVNLGQWLSPEFEVMVAEWVEEWLTAGRRPQSSNAPLPPHLARHMLNLGKVPPAYFSVLQELTTTLVAPFEAGGYSLPERLVPDISQGRMFAKYARDNLGLDTDALPTYDHEYQDGRIVAAKLYPAQYLGEFRRFIAEIWLPNRAEAYFRERDPAALPHLDRLLRLTYSQPTSSRRVVTARRFLRPADGASSKRPPAA